MSRPAALPPDTEYWTFDHGFAVARRDVADAVRDALARDGSLYAWAARQPGREVFHGRGETYAVRLGDVDAVVRHARRGGLAARFSTDWFLGPPRFLNELHVSRALAAAGVATPAVLAGVAHRAGLGSRSDVATARVAGRDLVTVLFAATEAAGARREEILRAAGGLIRRLHDAGWTHPDLQLRNLLVSLDDAPPVITLLDVDTCRRLARSSIAARRRNLARFYRSWEKWNRRRGPRLTADDRSAFEAGYGALP